MNKYDAIAKILNDNFPDKPNEDLNSLSKSMADCFSMLDPDKFNADKFLRDCCINEKVLVRFFLSAESYVDIECKDFDYAMDHALNSVYPNGEFIFAKIMTLDHKVLDYVGENKIKVTAKSIERRLEALNKFMGNPVKPWIKNSYGEYVSMKDCLFLEHSYLSWEVHSMVNSYGGVTVLLSAKTARELLELIIAYAKGYEESEYRRMKRAQEFKEGLK